MANQTLENRVERLEQQMAKLCDAHSDAAGPADDEWEETVGMFRGDPVFQEMIEATERRHEAERRLASEQRDAESP